MTKSEEDEGLTSKWRQIIMDYQTSCLSIKGYAQSQQVAKSSLYKWSKRLGLPLKQAPLSFIELEPLDKIPYLETFPIEVRINNRSTVAMTAPWPKVIELVKALI